MNETIAAIATPPGRGGVGIIRISGPQALQICRALIDRTPRNRYAHFAQFKDKAGAVIDEGLALFFKQPNSFTGEDILELHGHGGPVILDMLLRRVLSLGARPARAGEFSERAFLNNKIDLIQAEAVAQLIDASSEQAANAAMRSLQGDFSKQINDLVEALIRLRLYIEAAMDFPEEEINFLAEGKVQQAVAKLQDQLLQIKLQAKQGVLLSEGVNVVIAGRPNAGKSTLLNKLSGHEAAIVTPVAGTTRDIVKVQINLDGVLLHVLDTAGLRETEDVVEQAGIARTQQALELADLILFVVDGSESFDAENLFPDIINSNKQLLVLINKIDQVGLTPKVESLAKHRSIYLSAHCGDGLDLLRAQIKEAIGASKTSGEGGVFLARRRHLHALQRAYDYMTSGLQQLIQQQAGELLAEELKLAQQELSQITGEFSSDDLLGRIFSEFCIGK